MVDVIRAKRDGAELTGEQIGWAVSAHARGVVPDEQMAALLMAVVWRGMTARETAQWTAAMIASGTRLDLSGLPRPTVDKHSTGGVGDKTTLPLGPVVAACGAIVPQLSGRGLGHTGGTLDKLESIPGWSPRMDPATMLGVLADVGAVVAAAGADLAPADARLYALRDVTATVDSIPLIASSIMSKKIAEGTAALVLDVKVGSGAFMRDQASAVALAEAMVELGHEHGVATRALVTSMSTPLGRTAGNALEVLEALEVLSGGGPPDVRELTLTLAAEMLDAAGVAADPAAALDGGRAMDVWRSMVRAQGGDPDAPLPTARHRHTLVADRDGHLTRVEARGVGMAAWRLGAGRARKEDPVSAAAGVELHAQQGDLVYRGQVLATAHADTEELLTAGLPDLVAALEVGDLPGARDPLILTRVS